MKQSEAATRRPRAPPRAPPPAAASSSPPARHPARCCCCCCCCPRAGPGRPAAPGWGGAAAAGARPGAGPPLAAWGRASTRRREQQRGQKRPARPTLRRARCGAAVAGLELRWSFARGCLARGEPLGGSAANAPGNAPPERPILVWPNVRPQNDRRWQSSPLPVLRAIKRTLRCLPDKVLWLPVFTYDRVGEMELNFDVIRTQALERPTTHRSTSADQRTHSSTLQPT